MVGKTSSKTKSPRKLKFDASSGEWRIPIKEAASSLRNFFIIILCGSNFVLRILNLLSSSTFRSSQLLLSGLKTFKYKPYQCLKSSGTQRITIKSSQNWDRLPLAESSFPYEHHKTPRRRFATFSSAPIFLSCSFVISFGILRETCNIYLEYNIEVLIIEMTGRKPWCIRVQITAVTSTFYPFAGFVYVIF